MNRFVAVAAQPGNLSQGTREPKLKACGHGVFFIAATLAFSSLPTPPPGVFPFESIRARSLRKTAGTMQNPVPLSPLL